MFLVCYGCSVCVPWASNRKEHSTPNTQLFLHHLGSGEFFKTNMAMSVADWWIDSSKCGLMRDRLRNNVFYDALKSILSCFVVSRSFCSEQIPQPQHNNLLPQQRKFTSTVHNNHKKVFTRKHIWRRFTMWRNYSENYIFICQWMIFPSLTFFYYKISIT